jgi:hypothetical protein
MDDPLDAISQDLYSEHERLAHECQTLKAQLRETECKLKRVHSAVKSLADKPTNKSASKTTKPSASKAQVVAIVDELLHEQTVIPVEKLRSRIEQRVVASGKSRMGLALRIKEALATPRFATTDVGVRLVSDVGSAKQPHIPQEANNGRAPQTN